MALAHQIGQLAHDRAAHADGVIGAVEGEHVAAEEDLAVEVLLERLHDNVLRAGQLGGHVVGKLELQAH